jgi:hypothetical protein
MSEEQQGGFLTQLKNQILAGVGVTITALSTMFIDEIKSIVGIEDPVEETTTEPAKPQDIIINIPEQKKDTVVKKVYVAPKKEKTETQKRKDEGFDW